MAYGEVAKPGIPENSDLTFDVELLSCDKDELADIDVGSMAAVQTNVEETAEETVDSAIAAAEGTQEWHIYDSCISIIFKDNQYDS